MPKLIPVDHDPFNIGIDQKPALGTAQLMANKLFGLEGQERYQMWPEKMARSGYSLPGEVYEGKFEVKPSGPNGMWTEEDEFRKQNSIQTMIERAQDTSGLMGTGGLVGPGGVALGSGPMLRPALKYKEKIYKAKEGQQHLDALPENLRDEFQQMALSGEDISHYNFGFMDHRGRFLQREDALKYAIDNGMIDPQDAKFGTLTSTMFADSGKPGAGMSALAKQNKQGFYSAVESAVDNIGQNKASGDQWLGTLSNQKGVKGEELEFTGLTEFLKGKQNVSKGEIQEYLKNNKVELGETWKGGNPDAIAKSYYESMPNNTVKWEDLTQIQKDTFDRLAPKSKTKYQDYQLPGGENYRELLLTLPENKRIKELDDVLQKNQMSRDKWDSLSVDQQNKILAEKSLANSEKAELKKQSYRSSHWDEPNILAHMRMNDRTIDGKKSLHLEEIQSDWLQSHRNETDKIKQALNKDFDTIAAKMVEAGIIKKICD